MSGTTSHAKALISEFLKALLDSHTYLPHKNLETVFGFLWGLPIPIFALAIYFYATGSAWTFQSSVEVIRDNPLYVVFLLHPLIFAVIFGALGTMRLRRDRHIQHLIVDLEQHCEQLCSANERLTQVDRLKSEFLANVTHELKSPLVTALGYSDRILNEKLGPVTERQRNALSVSKRNLIRLRGLIEEILDFSRLEAGVGKFKMEPTSLKTLVDAAMSDMILKARERKISIVTDVPVAQAWVSGDKSKLTQAIENLLDNAIKFSPDGEKVKLSVASDEKFWHIRIADAGVGIDPETLPLLFQRFSQADGSLSKPFSGMGLGLVIVRKIIEAHGGEVWLESQKGTGTTAHIKLPQVAEPPAPTEPELAPIVAGESQSAS
jgi:signal transduction histidine kinase